MIKKIILLITILCNICNAATPNCQKLWDMNNRINGIEIYKMGLYACIEGPTPNLRGTIPELISPNITILNNSQILSNDTNYKSNNSESVNNTQNNNVNNETNLFTTKQSVITTLPPNIYTTLPPNIDTTLPPNIDTTLPPNIDTTLPPNNNSYYNNSHNDLFNSPIENNIEINNPTINTQNIVIVSIICGSVACCGIVSFFIYKAHIKSKHKLSKGEKPEKDIENGENLKIGQLANSVYYSNKLRNKLGNRNGRDKGFKNRNSWSKDNRIQPEKASLPPKLPEPSMKLNINSYKNKKPGLSLNVKTEVPTQKFQIREIHKKTHGSFVPGSPRRRLPTPPQRAPPPPEPEFASKSLASKLDSMTNNKFSPKIQRIVQKNK